MREYFCTQCNHETNSLVGVEFVDGLYECPIHGIVEVATREELDTSRNFFDEELSSYVNLANPLDME